MKQALKKLSKRLEFWFAWGIMGILLDEYIKEGYFFQIGDIFTLFTHENLILILILMMLFSKVFKYVHDND